MGAITYTEVVLTIIAVCIVGATVYGAFIARKLIEVLDQGEELQRALLSLTPHLDSLVRETEATMRSLRRNSERAEAITEDLGQISDKARRSTLPALESVATLASSLRQVAALVVGVKAGLRALASGDDDEDRSTKERTPGRKKR